MRKPLPRLPQTCWSPATFCGPRKKTPSFLTTPSRAKQVIKTRKTGEKERNQYLALIRSKPAVTEQEKERYLILENMSYPEFLGLYLDDEPLGGYSHFGNGPVSVGHVGIVQIVEGQPTVVEAMTEEGSVGSVIPIGSKAIR